MFIIKQKLCTFPRKSKNNLVLCKIKICRKGRVNVTNTSNKNLHMLKLCKLLCKQNYATSV